jgi:hypothetical protein
MTRGIHLKQLKNADLTALGLEQDPPEGEVPDAPTGILAETDPVLSQLVNEVRQGLEDTLELLKKALEENEKTNT